MHGLRANADTRRIARSDLQHVDRATDQQNHHRPRAYVPTTNCNAFNGTTPSTPPTGSSRSPWNVSTVPVQLGAAGIANE